MPAPRDVPAVLRTRPFTIAQAEAFGVTRKMLRGRRFRRLFPGVYVLATVELTWVLWLYAAMLVLPHDAVVSHLSAMRLWGLDLRRGPLEFSTNTTAVTEHDRIRLHRRGGRLSPSEVDGLPVTGPDRTFVDCALTLSFVQLVQLGDHLLHSGTTTYDRLERYCRERHLHGVQRARRAVLFVAEGVESPRETVVRLMLVFARLPCPVVNREVRDAGGRFVARVDMLYERYKVIVEYDGWQHERDGRQRQRDRERRELLEALGYRLIIVTDEDLRHPAAVPWRVHHALVARGYDGPEPSTSVVWLRWFTRP